MHFWDRLYKKIVFSLFSLLGGEIKINYLRKIGVRIGDKCDILTRIENFGSEPWLIEIGNYVTVSSGVSFITHDGASRLFRNRYPDMNPIFGNRFGTIIIKNNCFIGMNATILPDVTIGPNSIVGACSVVTKSVREGFVVAGNPARELYSIEEYIDRYRSKMIRVTAMDRKLLQEELTNFFWKEKR